MREKGWWQERTLRFCVVITLCVIVLDGFLTTFIMIRPFWIDEWRIIYNLKTKSIPALWGPLDYLQQFPRLYLSVVKGFTSLFNYSYWSLRLPSFITGTLAVLLGWHIMRRIYPAADWLRYLLVMIVVSSVPFTKYFVQVKQYSMDIALSLLAVWQLLELLRPTDYPLRPVRYLLLCSSLLLAPFFSYTYPIAIAPVYVVMLIAYVKSGARSALIARQWLPLLLCAAGIAAFYFVDARQLLADKGMKAFWQYNLAAALDAGGILSNFYTVFAQVGSGFVFQTIFGVLGTLAFFRACWQALSDIRNKQQMDCRAWARLYSLLLLVTVAGLFLAGKLPLGESRLNAFITVSVAILVIDLLHWLLNVFPRNKVVIAAGALLYIGVVGNIFTTLIGNYADPDLSRRRQIYATTGEAISLARERQAPILVTPGVAYPYEADQNLPDTTSTVPGDWVLKTHPAYRISKGIPVYPIRTFGDATSVLDTLDPAVNAAVVCDGISIEIISRN